MLSTLLVRSRQRHNWHRLRGCCIFATEWCASTSRKRFHRGSSEGLCDQEGICWILSIIMIRCVFFSWSHPPAPAAGWIAGWLAALAGCGWLCWRVSGSLRWLGGCLAGSVPNWKSLALKEFVMGRITVSSQRQAVPLESLSALVANGCTPYKGYAQ
jgi:hypothetical protein